MSHVVLLQKPPWPPGADPVAEIRGESIPSPEVPELDWHTRVDALWEPSPDCRVLLTEGCSNPDLVRVRIGPHALTYEELRRLPVSVCYDVSAVAGGAYAPYRGLYFPAILADLRCRFLPSALRDLVRSLE